MKTNANDMERKDFWALNRAARIAVGSLLKLDFLAAMSDKEAKAVDEAVDALTKALILQADKIS